MFHQKISVFHIHPESLFKVHSKPSVDFVRILYGGMGGRGWGQKKMSPGTQRKSTPGFFSETCRVAIPLSEKLCFIKR